MHDEVVIECDAEAAQETVRCLGDTLRSVFENVLGRPELAGHDVVETSVLGSWERRCPEPTPKGAKII